MNRKVRCFWSIMKKWSPAETELLLEALKRDRSLRPKELSKFIGSKSYNEVRELIFALLSVSDKEIIGTDFSAKATPRKPESTLDILIQTTKHISPNEFACSKATGDVLRLYAYRMKAGVNSGSNAADTGLNYATLFQFLASLFSDEPPIPLETLEASAVLDLLTCIIQVMKQFNSTPAQDISMTNQDNTPSEQSTVQEVYQAAVDKVTQLVGTYLASAAAVQLVGFQSPRSAPYESHALKLHPVAPFFVLDSVQRPCYLKVTHALRTVLFQKLSEQWNLPRLTENSVDIKCSPEDPHFRQLTRLMNQFTLNPFGFSLNWMKPFQQLACEMCKPPTGGRSALHLESPQVADTNPIMSCMQLLRGRYLPQTSSFPNRLTRPRDSTADSSSDRPLTKRSRVEEKSDKNSAPLSEVDIELPASAGPKIPPSRLSVRKSDSWKKCNFYTRLSDKRESRISKATMNKYILVRDSISTTPIEKKRRLN